MRMGGGMGRGVEGVIGVGVLGVGEVVGVEGLGEGRVEALGRARWIILWVLCLGDRFVERCFREGMFVGI